MKVKMRHKDDYTAGLEKILNDPRTSFLSSPQTFNEIHKSSGMSIGAMLKHLGKRAKEKQPAGPTDDELSKRRLAILEP